MDVYVILDRTAAGGRDLIDLGSVLLEAVLIGVAASIAGVAFGIAFAALLRSGFNAIGASLPATTLQIQPRSVVAGLVVGLLVTVVAALVPAWRASRVPPMAAMREVQMTGSPRARLAVAILFTALGIWLVLTGQLAEAGFVEPKGRRETPGRPTTWGTTKQFLAHFGLASLKDLPRLDELKAAGLLELRPGALPPAGGSEEGTLPEASEAEEAPPPPLDPGDGPEDEGARGG